MAGLVIVEILAADSADGDQAVGAGVGEFDEQAGAGNAGNPALKDIADAIGEEMRDQAIGGFTLGLHGASLGHPYLRRDLARVINGGKDLTFACNSEFYVRPDGLHPLEKDYGFHFSQGDIKRMDTGLTYQALKDRQVNVALVFATDGRIPAFNFVVLKDNKDYFPSYAMTPVIRKATLDANPTLGPLLNALSAKLDAPTMASLNASVDVQKKSFSDVAETFLKSTGLI